MFAESSEPFAGREETPSVTETNQLAQSLCRLHVDYAKSLSQISDGLNAGGEDGVLLWLNQRKDHKSAFAMDICDHFGLTPGRVANIIKKLEQRGYIIRKPNPEDQRKYEILLTDEGVLHSDYLFQKMYNEYCQLIRVIGEEDVAHGMNILHHVIRFMEME